MNKEILLAELKEKSNIKIYTDRIIKNEELLPLLLEIAKKEKSATKYTAEKIVRKLSEDIPEMLVPYIDEITALSDDDNTFIKLGFVKTLGNVIQSSKKDLPRAREWYLKLLDTTSVAVFGNVLSGMSKLIRRYPQIEEDVMLKVLQANSHKFLFKGEASSECVDVAKGHIIDLFFDIYEESNFKKEILAFVQDNLENARPKVRSKCKKFIKKYS